MYSYMLYMYICIALRCCYIYIHIVYILKYVFVTRNIVYNAQKVNFHTSAKKNFFLLLAIRVIKKIYMGTYTYIYII